jgi:hypothetical protein
MFVVMLFCLPETLYVRGSTPVVTSRPILRRLNLWGLRPEGKHLKASDFLRPFQMCVFLLHYFPPNSILSQGHLPFGHHLGALLLGHLCPELNPPRCDLCDSFPSRRQVYDFANRLGAWVRHSDWVDSRRTAWWYRRRPQHVSQSQRERRRGRR